MQHCVQIGVACADGDQVCRHRAPGSGHQDAQALVLSARGGVLPPGLHLNQLLPAVVDVFVAAGHG